MSSPNPSRRSLFTAAACLPAVTAAPALAASHLYDGGASPDAELLAMVARLATLRAETEGAADASSDASDAYTASLPPVPEALRITAQDRHHWPYLHQDADETHFTGMQVLAFEQRAANEERCGGQPSSGPCARYRHERGQEILASWSAWRTACETGRCGDLRHAMNAAEERAEAAYEAQWALEQSIREAPTHSVQGLRAKALTWIEDEATEQETFAFMRGVRADLERM